MYTYQADTAARLYEATTTREADRIAQQMLRELEIATDPVRRPGQPRCWADHVLAVTPLAVLRRLAPHRPAITTGGAGR